MLHGGQTLFAGALVEASRSFGNETPSKRHRRVAQLQRASQGRRAREAHFSSTNQIPDDEAHFWGRIEEGKCLRPWLQRNGDGQSSCKPVLLFGREAALPVSHAASCVCAGPFRANNLDFRAEQWPKRRRSARRASPHLAATAIHVWPRAPAPSRPRRERPASLSCSQIPRKLGQRQSRRRVPHVHADLR